MNIRCYDFNEPKKKYNSMRLLVYNTCIFMRVGLSTKRKLTFLQFAEAAPRTKRPEALPSAFAQSVASGGEE